MTTVPNAPGAAPDAERTWSPGRIYLVLLLVVFAAFLLPRLSRDLPLNEHECLIGQTTREMGRAGDWLIPRYGGEPRLQKPPLAYWTAGFMQAVVGRLDARALRLPSVLSAIGCAAAVWSLAGTLFDRRVALLATCVFATMAGVLYYGRSGMVDMPLALWCTLSVLAFERGLRAADLTSRRIWLLLFYVLLGEAMLVKLPMPLAVVPPGLLAYLFVTRRLREVPRLFLVPGLLAFVAVFGWWVLVVGRTVGFDTLGLKWHHEFVTRFRGGLGEDELRSGYYAIGALAGLALPWVFALPHALCAPYRGRYAEQRRSLWLPWCLLVSNVLIFTLADFKRAQYLLPALPYAAILIGAVMADPFWRSGRLAGLAHTRAALLAGFVVVAGGIASYAVMRALSVPAWTVAAAAAVGGTGLLAAVWLRAAGFARAAFLAVALTGAIAFHASSALVLRSSRPALDFGAFGEGVRRVADISPTADLRWVEAPDPRLVFHTDQPWRRLLGDLAVAHELRRLDKPYTDRAAIELLGDRAVEALAAGTPVFLVAKARRLDEWAARSRYAELGHLVYRHASFDGDPRNDLVVVTNRAGLASVHREARRRIVYPAVPAASSSAPAPLTTPTTLPGRFAP